jgi:hypothetical protein
MQPETVGQRSWQIAGTHGPEATQATNQGTATVAAVSGGQKGVGCSASDTFEET